jgi:hypothetical protein
MQEFFLECFLKCEISRQGFEGEFMIVDSKMRLLEQFSSSILGALLRPTGTLNQSESNAEYNLNTRAKIMLEDVVG